MGSLRAVTARRYIRPNADDPAIAMEIAEEHTPILRRTVMLPSGRVGTVQQERNGYVDVRYLDRGGDFVKLRRKLVRVL